MGFIISFQKGRCPTQVTRNAGGIVQNALGTDTGAGEAVQKASLQMLREQSVFIFFLTKSSKDVTITTNPLFSQVGGYESIWLPANLRHRSFFLVGCFWVGG
jgi:hypothetical protein